MDRKLATVRFQLLFSLRFFARGHVLRTGAVYSHGLALQKVLTNSFLYYVNLTRIRVCLLRSFYRRPLTTFYGACGASLDPSTLADLRWFHPVFIFWVLTTLLLLALWLLLLALRLDELIPVSFRFVWLPVWTWCVGTHYVIWWVMGVPNTRTFAAGWTARRTAEISAAFADPLLAMFVISNVLLVLKWDYMYYVQTLIIAAPVAVYGILAFVTACFTLFRSVVGYGFGIIVLYWMGAVLLFALRSDWLLSWCVCSHYLSRSHP